MEGFDSFSRLFFHHEAHQRWSKRRMEFWFLAADSLYSQAKAKEALGRVAAELGLATYATYELIGKFDLLVRLYLHPEDARDFEKALEKHFGPRDVSPFRVTEVARHWVWAEGPDDDGDIVVPEKATLEQWYPRSELAVLGDYSDTSREREELIDDYAQLNLVRRDVRTPGIKLVVILSFPEGLSSRQRATIRRGLEDLLDERRDVLSERSLYVGEAAQRDQFLLMCRIPLGDFNLIRERLIEPIGRAVGGVPVRTETYPVVSDDFVCFSERIAVDDLEEPDLLELLRQGGEQQTFEVKGSCFAPLEPWLKKGKPLQEAPNFPLQSVLKAIVGMLNGLGGTVLVGAVERKDFKTSKLALEKLAQYPSVGGMGDEFVIVGLVDPTFRDHGWDAWRSRLDALIASKIDPKPGVLVEVVPLEFESQQVCRITVDEPRETQRYYLREGKDQHLYYARVGGQTLKKSGADIERHRDQLQDRRRKRRRGRR